MQGEVDNYLEAFGQCRRPLLRPHAHDLNHDDENHDDDHDDYDDVDDEDDDDDD